MYVDMQISARRGVVAIGGAAAADGIAGADMVAASQLAGALDVWLTPALAPLKPETAKEIYVQVALVASVTDRWVDPADGSHFSRIVLRWEDVDKVIRRALHGDARLEQVLEALPGRLDDGIEVTARPPDWMQLKWAQVPDEMRRELPLSHVIEAKADLANEASKEDKDEFDSDLDMMEPQLPTSAEPASKESGDDEAATATTPSVEPATKAPSKSPETKPLKDKKKRPLIKRKAKPEAVGPSSAEKSAAPDAKENE